MKQMTEQHLINAFGGESMAHMRYLHFSRQAAKKNSTISPGCLRLLPTRSISTPAIITASSNILTADLSPTAWRRSDPEIPRKISSSP
jgi:hypothetical protein